LGRFDVSWATGLFERRLDTQTLTLFTGRTKQTRGRSERYGKPHPTFIFNGIDFAEPVASAGGDDLS
jgi:hypothetical protein